MKGRELIMHLTAYPTVLTSIMDGGLYPIVLRVAKALRLSKCPPDYHYRKMPEERKLLDMEFFVYYYPHF